MIRVDVVDMVDLIVGVMDLDLTPDMVVTVVGSLDMIRDMTRDMTRDEIIAIHRHAIKLSDGQVKPAVRIEYYRLNEG